ncbi:hypothetical protein AVEN_163752-1 [Araneus ventricosus]|uniref:Uncharacterized protein n=1 Tax=Araneus ventricosus TaxID=182803 RepID=A0A4Y2W8A5_ARAVE|nr:hypothetical protein AVEN_163752-1 [Araneus ventricosus]
MREALDILKRGVQHRSTNFKKLWRTVLRHLTLMYISQYLPPDIGNSFCLVVRMFGSGPKVVTRGQRTRNNNFQSHRKMAVPKIRTIPSSATFTSTTTPTAKQLSQFKIYDTVHSTKPVTHFTARSLWSAKPALAFAPTIWAAICAYARSTSLPCYSDNIKQVGGCFCGAPCNALLL